MAISFPITGVSGTYSGTRSPSFTLGTSPVENDIIVAYVASNTASAVTEPSEWVNPLGAGVEESLSDNTHAAAMVYHRVTAAEDTANTVTWTLTNLWAATETGRISVAVLRGVSLVNELVGSSSGSNIALTDGTIPSVTTTANATVIAGFSQDGTGTRTSAPTGYTDIAGGTATQHCYIYRQTTDAVSGVATTTAAANTSTNDEYASIIAAFKEVPAVPSAIADLSGTAGDTEVALTWTAPSDNGSAITDYSIEYLPDGGSWTSFSDGVSTSTSATVTGLTNDTAYTFRVAAINDGGIASWSNTAGPYTPTGPIGPVLKRHNGSTWVAAVTKHGAGWPTKPYNNLV